MMDFRKLNNITGWVVFAIACATYTFTREATASLWDCGEFIACANELGIPHPPGSPLFTMLGRVFILLFSGGNAAHAAHSVNLLSAFASAFTILFLFWTITHFARKMFVNHGEELTGQQLFSVMTAGVIGSLVYTFSDTFWFSAVEGEVYALSSFFTALIVWSMLKWEHAYEIAKNVTEKNRADRWIVFIFFMVGLAITVHLLNLLTIPVIVMIYYFKKYTFTGWKSFIAFIIACALTGLALLAIVYLIPRWSATFDRIFVNSFHLPFFTGFAFFFVLMGLVAWFGLNWASRKGKSSLRLLIWCGIFILAGYSTYITTLIRSNANPGIDMSNVDNPMSLASYFGREQYGSAPLIYGHHFAANPIDDKEKRMKWAKLGNKYVELGREREYVYDKSDMMFFPRVWDNSGQQGHTEFYANWLNLSAYQDPQTGRVNYEKPTYADNMNWFFSYQMSLMYWRYFMWNFSGRNNDIQGLGNRRDGNWQTGIPLIDKQMLGDTNQQPESLKKNKANNKLYMLPFLLGVLGFIYQFLKNRKDWVVNFMLFFFTGIAIGLYLNMPGNQPRERDYAFVGSFYAFSIWIGLAVIALVKGIKETRQQFTNTLAYGAVITFVVTAFSLVQFPGGTVLKTSLMAAALFAILTAGITYIAKAASSNGARERNANIVIGLLCLVVPVIMASQEWDDHDRSNKVIARDIATDYLESCAPNAILFSFGDNDTYPLWYAQEVEKIRPDIRIVNTSLLGIDWYINQLRYKINQSDSIDVIWSPEQIMGDRRQYMQYYAPPNVPQEEYFDLYDVMKNVLGQGDDMKTFPVKKFKIPVDTALVRANGTVNPDDLVPNEIRIDISGNFLQRDELIILNIIASNRWQRPIYFTSPKEGLGLERFMRKDGTSYHLVPVSNNSRVNADWMMNNLMNKFKSGNADKKGVYFDEENRRHLIGLRQAYAELARDLISKGRKEDAAKVIRKIDRLVLDSNVPYGMPSRFELHNQASTFLMDAAYSADAKDVADKISKALNRDLNQQMEYYAALGDNMSRTQLENILQQYATMKFTAQNDQQKNQAEAYYQSNLGPNQLNMAYEISRTFDIYQYVKQLEQRYNPAPADSTVATPDSLPLNIDTTQQ